jgi:large subunit ribosomal protein L31e
MAKKKDTPKTVLERTYNVPLRKEFQKVARWKKTKKAVKALREFLAKHMKSEDVKLSKELNEKIWKHGIKNPPHHVKVSVTKDDKGVVKADLFEKKKAVPKKEAKPEVKKEEKSEAEKPAEKKEEPKPSEKKE